MRFPRMTTRRWMTVIALAAVLIAAEERLRSLRASYILLRDEHKQEEEMLRLAWRPSGLSKSLDIPGGDDLEATLNRYVKSLMEHHSALRKKYEYAASHPWWAVTPDPPAPAAPGISLY